MSKMLKSHNLSKRPANRTLLAVSLCATMAAFGCTTDRNLGNGDPVVTPGLRTSPTGNMGGSETASTPPPMMSSYSGEALPAVRPRIARVSAAEAAAIMAEHQPRVRYLGPGAPGMPNRPYVSDLRTNPVSDPANYYGSRSTVNSSLTSGPTAVVTSGAGEAIGGGVDAAAFVNATGTVVNSGTNVTAPSTLGGSAVIGTTGGTTAVTNPNTLATVTPSATTVSPTASSVFAPSGMAATRTLSPTAASVVNPPASVSAVSSATPTATRATAARQTATASPTAAATTAGAVASQVRVVTDANGRVTVTNRQQ